MADLRDLIWFYRQKQFEELASNLGKGAGLLGLAGDIPQGWEPPPMPPDPLRDFEWMPRRGFFLGFSNDVGDNSIVSEAVLPSMGADSVALVYRVYNLQNEISAHEPRLQLQTASDPTNPASWAILGTAATIDSNKVGTVGAIEVSASIGRFIRWRLYLPATAGQDAYVELQASITVNSPYSR